MSLLISPCLSTAPAGRDKFALTAATSLSPHPCSDCGSPRSNDWGRQEPAGAAGLGAGTSGGLQVSFMAMAVAKSRARLSLLVGEGLVHGSTVHVNLEVRCALGHDPAIGAAAPVAERAARCGKPSSRCGAWLIAGRRQAHPKAERRDGRAALSGAAAI